MSKKEDTTKKDTINQSIDALREKMVWFKKELFNLRFQKSLGDLKNTSRFSVIRKNIARIQTELTKRSKSMIAGGK